MASQRKFYRTVIEVEILSEYLVNFESLDDVAYDITYGDCSGQWEVKSQDEVDGTTMAKLLITQGSEPGFFLLDKEGNSVEEE